MTDRELRLRMKIDELRDRVHELEQLSENYKRACEKYRGAWGDELRRNEDRLRAWQKGGAIRYQTDEERIEARRRSWRESKQRRRAEAA